MTALPHIEYFLGANSPSGFYSLYDHLLPPEQARAIYILKGGPGCGKSTLMRKVAAWAQEAGLETEYILCSGDPDSLDAVVFPDKAAAIVDGTAPQGWFHKYILLRMFCFAKRNPQSASLTAPFKRGLAACGRDGGYDTSVRPAR